MSRKDSKGLFANVLGTAPAPATEDSQNVRSTSPHLQKVAAGVRQIQERGELADRLFRDGEHVVELDPDIVLASAIVDRFEDVGDAHLIEGISDSIKLRGQIVPGLVRPFPGRTGYFQIVYGRRRLAAAKSLGLKFRATVRELTDEQAIVFQGEENTNRNDLSFIEKCAFAREQEKAGFSREVICASLSTGKSHVSEMLRVASILPHDILRRIGAAKDVGRRRWLDFVEKWEANVDARQLAERVLTTLPASTPSAQKFQSLLNDLGQPTGLGSKTRDTLRVTSKGLTLAKVEYSDAGSKVRFEKSVPVDFVQFIVSRIASLHDEYLAENEGLTQETK